MNLWLNWASKTPLSLNCGVHVTNYTINFIGWKIIFNNNHYFFLFIQFCYMWGALAQWDRTGCSIVFLGKWGKYVLPNPSSNVESIEDSKYVKSQNWLWDGILRYFDFPPHNSKSSLPTTATFWCVESYLQKPNYK